MQNVLVPLTMTICFYVFWVHIWQVICLNVAATSNDCILLWAICHVDSQGKYAEKQNQTTYSSPRHSRHHQHRRLL